MDMMPQFSQQHYNQESSPVFLKIDRDSRKFGRGIVFKTETYGKSLILHTSKHLTSQVSKEPLEINLGFFKKMLLLALWFRK